MRSFAQIIGTVILAFYALAWLDVLDFSLCIGKHGACQPHVTVKPRVTA